MNEPETQATVRDLCNQAARLTDAEGTFLLGDIASIGLATNAEWHLDWLASYVAPHYKLDRMRRGVATAKVTAVVDRALYREFRAVTSLFKTERVALYQEEPVLESRLGSLTMHRYERRPLVAVLDEGRYSTIVCDPDDEEAKLEPIRHIREIFTKELESQHWFVYHMAAVKFDGSGVGLVGAKGAGKSTLALGMCAAGAELISNDRSYINMEGDQARIRSWPTTAALGLGTICAYPELQPWLADPSMLTYRPQIRYQTGIGLNDFLSLPPEERSQNPDKLELTYSEVVKSFGTSLAEEANLDLLVIPRLTLTSSASAAVKRAAPGVAELLRDQCFTPHDERYPDFLHLRNSAVSALESAANQQIDQILRSVPVVEVEYSTGRDGAEAIRAFLEAQL